MTRLSGRSHPASQAPATRKAKPVRGTGELARALGAAAVLAVLLPGLPALLWVIGGFPLPTSLPSPDEIGAALSRPDSGELLVHALLLTAWAGWAAFAVSVAVEAVAQARGRYAARMPGLAPVQQLAGWLVAALAVMIPTTPLGLATSGPSGPLTTISAPRTPSASPGAVPEETADKPSANDVPIQSTHTAPTERTGHAQKIYVVQPPHDGHRDSLWAIAARHLGDPLRWREIAALNLGRPQPDGRSLTDPHWIYPGWRLLMPDDAVDLPVHAHPNGQRPDGEDSVASRPAPEEPGPRSKAAPPPPTVPASPRAPSPQPPATGHGAHPAAEAPTQAVDDDSTQQVPGMVALAGAGLLAAGVTAALARLRAIQRRRRRTGQRPPRPATKLLRAEAELRVLAEPDNRQFLDLALRSLSHLIATRSAPEARLPDVLGARLSASRLELILAQPTGPPPEPFTAARDGAVWVVDQDAELPLTPETVGDFPAPFPGLVPIGHDDDGLVLLDLEACGSLAITGAPRDTEAVLRWITAELAVNGWSDYLQATLVGFEQELVGLDPERLHYVEALSDDVLLDLNAWLPKPDHRSTERLLASRLGNRGEPWPPEFLLLARPPDPGHAERLQQMLGDNGRSGLAVVVAGEWPPARATLHVHDDGLVDVGPLGLTVRSNRLPSDAAQAMTDLLQAARVHPRDNDPETPPEPGSASRDATVDRAATAIMRDEPPDVPANADDGKPEGPSSDEFDATVAAYLDETVDTIARVRILGPVQVRASGPVEAKRVGVCTELIVHLATHGRHVDKPAELDVALWPDRAVQLSTRTEAIARARRWLGGDAGGNLHLPHGYGGELRLGPGVLLDWDLFQRLVARALNRGAQGKADLATALRLVRGKPFEGIPSGRYRWLAETFLEQDIPAAVVDAAHQLARLCLDSGDPAGARDAARTAQLVDRYDERPWRDLIEAEHTLGNHGQIRALVDDLMTVLEVEVDDELTDETRELIAGLLPPHRGSRPRSA
jgi:hypothetical protein